MEFQTSQFQALKPGDKRAFLCCRYTDDKTRGESKEVKHSASHACSETLPSSRTSVGSCGHLRVERFM